MKTLLSLINQDLIELYFPASPDVGIWDFTGVSATQQEEDKKGGFGGEKKKIAAH